jgi:hypothetical protein
VDGDVRTGLLSDATPLITVEPTRLDHRETEALVGELTDELRDRDGDGDVLYELSVYEFSGPAGAASCARVGGCAAGVRRRGSPPGFEQSSEHRRTRAAPNPGDARTAIRSSANSAGYADEPLSVCLEKWLR